MKCAIKTSLVALCALLPAVGATRASLVADTCQYNTYMCCWTENDNGVEDNADVCLVNGEFKEGDETVHCHGLVWADGASFESFILPLYKYVRTFDHRDARGYYGKIEGAPQCECIEQMPIVTRADCTTYSSQGLVACKNNDLRTHYEGEMESPGGELPNLIKNCNKARGKEDEFPDGDKKDDEEREKEKDVPKYEDTMGSDENEDGEYEDPVNEDDFGEDDDTDGSMSYDQGDSGDEGMGGDREGEEDDDEDGSMSYDQGDSGDEGMGGDREGEEDDDEDGSMSYDQGDSGDEGMGGDREGEEDDDEDGSMSYDQGGDSGEKDDDPMDDPEKNTLGDSRDDFEGEMDGCPEEHDGDSSSDEYHSNEY